jgi:hypothetical protein
MSARPGVERVTASCRDQHSPSAAAVNVIAPPSNRPTSYQCRNRARQAQKMGHQDPGRDDPERGIPVMQIGLDIADLASGVRSRAPQAALGDVARAEATGLNTAWVPVLGGGPDPVAVCALAAGAGQRIELAAGVVRIWVPASGRTCPRGLQRGTGFGRRILPRRRRLASRGGRAHLRFPVRRAC